MHHPTMRVLQVLALVTRERTRLRLSDFSTQLQIPKSTLLPILQTLCAQKYLAQDEMGRYAPGTALFSLGAAFSGGFPVLEYVRTHLEHLVNVLGETCYFGVLEDGQVLYLDKVDSPEPLRILTPIGHRRPAYATGLGKVLLSEKTEQELRALYPKGMEALTDNTVTEISRLAQQTAQVRIDGYAWEVEESTRHIRCFAVPVKKHGRIIAAISVAIPIFRYDPSRKAATIATLQSTAGALGQLMEETDAHLGDIF